MKYISNFVNKHYNVSGSLQHEFVRRDADVSGLTLHVVMILLLLVPFKAISGS